MSQKQRDKGVPASPSGHSDEPASGLAANAGSVPNAASLLRELHSAFWDMASLRRISMQPWERDKAYAAHAVGERVRAFLGHAADCDWHCDQYPWECTCGLTAQAIEAGTAETGTGPACESAVGETDASTILNDICNQSAEALKPLGESE